MKFPRKGNSPRPAKAMDGATGLAAIRPNVAGVDIGSRTMHVCGPVEDDGRRERRMFATTTDEIQACVQWLKQVAVESVARESTGVCWIPVLEILESPGVEVLLVDTRPLSRVPGRKTDMTDCAWIQSLHSCGLLQGCFPRRRDRGTAQAGAAESGAGGRASRLGPAGAEMSGSDECAGASGGIRYARHDRDGDPSRDRSRPAGPAAIGRTA